MQPICTSGTPLLKSYSADWVITSGERGQFLVDVNIFKTRVLPVVLGTTETVRLIRLT